MSRMYYKDYIKTQTRLLRAYRETAIMKVFEQKRKRLIRDLVKYRAEVFDKVMDLSRHLADLDEAIEALAGEKSALIEPQLTDKTKFAKLSTGDAITQFLKTSPSRKFKATEIRDGLLAGGFIAGDKRKLGSKVQITLKRLVEKDKVIKRVLGGVATYSLKEPPLILMDEVEEPE